MAGGYNLPSTYRSRFETKVGDTTPHLSAQAAKRGDWNSLEQIRNSVRQHNCLLTRLVARRGVLGKHLVGGNPTAQSINRLLWRQKQFSK